MSTFSYLDITEQQRLYLVAYAAGDDQDKTCDDLGIDRTTVRAWRSRVPVFAQAEDEIQKDPKWAMRNIITPMAILQYGKNLTHGLTGHNGAEKPRINGKQLEVLMTMGGMIGPNQQIEAGGIGDVIARLGEALRLPQLNPPAQILDGQYTVTGEPPSDPI